MKRAIIITVIGAFIAIATTSCTSTAAYTWDEIDNAKLYDK